MEGNNQVEDVTTDSWWFMNELSVSKEEDTSSTRFLSSNSFDTFLDEHADPSFFSHPLIDPTYFDDQYFNQSLLDFPESQQSSEQLLTNYPPIPDFLNDFETWFNNNLSILAYTNEPLLEVDTQQVNDVGSSSVTTVMHDKESSVFGSDEGMKKRRSIKPKSDGLELQEIQKYFHLPIIKAAKELRVGVTVLKKRCRELEIARWPHRKIKSLKCLIDNVKELGMMNENEIELLEQQKKTMEKLPEVTMTLRTKKLRQACFKANYKRRRLLRSTL